MRDSTGTKKETEARRFLNQLASAITALEQPDVGDQISGKVAVQAKTVPELVRPIRRGDQLVMVWPG